MHKSVTFNNNFHALTTMNMQYLCPRKIIKYTAQDKIATEEIFPTEPKDALAGANSR